MNNFKNNKVRLVKADSLHNISNLIFNRRFKTKNGNTENNYQANIHTNICRPSRVKHELHVSNNLEENSIAESSICSRNIW